MSIKEAAKAPIKMINAVQLIDKEGSYIVRRSEKGSIVLAKRTTGSYYVETRSATTGREVMKDFDTLGEAVDMVNLLCLHL